MASDAKVEDKPAAAAPETKDAKATIAQGEDDEFEDFPVDGAYISCRWFCDRIQSSIRNVCLLEYSRTGRR